VARERAPRRCSACAGWHEPREPSGFAARICAGSLEDGTLGVRPVVLYGAAKFNASGRGRHSSPTTAMRRAFVTVCGAAWVRDANEHRSSKCCSRCHGVLDKVHHLTPERIYAAAAAKAETPLPMGWSRPPPRAIRPWRVVRGMLYCPSDECRSFRLRHRDKDACPLIHENAFSVCAAGSAAAGTIECMRAKARPGEAKPGVFDMWPC
jgi:hypothetical protein